MIRTIAVEVDSLRATVERYEPAMTAEDALERLAGFCRGLLRP